MNTPSTPTRRPRLSVAMIGRNEANVLAASIESLRSIADEIVVLDTGSTDETPELARRLGAAVITTSWKKDFSAARNQCLDFVYGDWVLWLDAGEQLEAASAEQLRHFIDQQSDAQRAYYLLVQVPPAVGGGSAEQVAQLRLMPNRPELRFTGRVRETLLPAIESAGIAVDVAPGRLLCHPRRNDPARKQAVARRNLELVALEAKDAGGPLSTRALLVCGEAHGDLSQRDEAEQAFRAAVGQAPHGSLEMREAYYGLLSTLEDGSVPNKRRLAICLESLGVFPLDAQLLLAMGSYVQAENRSEMAARSFEAALHHGQVDMQTWHLVELAEMAANCLSVSLQLQQREDQAVAVLEDALRRTPDSQRLLRRLVELYVKRGEEEAALAAAGRLAVPAEHAAALFDAVRGAVKAARQEWDAALPELLGAYQRGCCDPLCLRPLTVTLLARHQFEPAAAVLAQWQQREPGNPEVQAYLEAVHRRRQEVGASADTPSSVSPGATEQRHLRLDPGVDGLPPAPVPIISQFTSADVRQ